MTRPRHVVEQDIVSPDKTIAACTQCEWAAEIVSVNVPSVQCARCGFNAPADPPEDWVPAVLQCPECERPTLEYAERSDTKMNVKYRGDREAHHPVMAGVFNLSRPERCPIHDT